MNLNSGKNIPQKKKKTSSRENQNYLTICYAIMRQLTNLASMHMVCSKIKAERPASDVSRIRATTWPYPKSNLEPWVAFLTEAAPHLCVNVATHARIIRRVNADALSHFHALSAATSTRELIAAILICKKCKVPCRKNCSARSLKIKEPYNNGSGRGNYLLK